MLWTLGGIVAVFAAYILYDYVNHLRYCRQARRKGFALMKTELAFPLGLPQIVRLIQSGANFMVPEHIRQFLGNDKSKMSRVLGVPLVHTSDPLNIRAVLATQFGEYDVGELRWHQLKPLMGSSIFTLQGKPWEHSRAMLKPQFSRHYVSQLHEMGESVDVLVEMLKRDATAGKHVDIQELFWKLSLDTTTQFLFGETCDSLTDGSRIKGQEQYQLAAKFIDAFEDAEQYMVLRIMLSQLCGLVSLSPRFHKVNAICREFAEYYVRKTIRERDELEKSGRYYFLLEQLKQTDDPVMLRDEAMSLLIAGRDTTGAFLSMTFFVLARRPTVYNKLRQTILETFGHGTDLITFESLKRCEYLTWVLNEMLRVHPLVPFNMRVAQVDTTLPRGGGADGSEPVFVQKGTQVMYSIYGLHRDHGIWGDDADEFRPERWSEQKAKPWTFIPFNGGPRICIGQQFALAEAAYTVVRLLQTFDTLSTTDPRSDPPIDQRLAGSVAHGVPITLTVAE